MHAATNHARSLRRMTTTEFARALPGAPIGEARGGFLLSYSPTGEVLNVSAQRGRESVNARIDWAFGAGDQGVTPVARIGSRWFEHRISYYTKADRFDLTLGHQPGISRSAEAAIGIEQNEATIRSCFGCHATATAKLNEIRPGVECVRCHPAGGDHVVNPRKLSAKEQVGLCAECHRLTPPTRDPGDPLNVRFQPLRLTKSKCYRAGLTCSTCHPAHENARRQDNAFYSAKCVGCHTAPHRKEDCIPCHMPRSSPAPYLSFTDHYIR